MQPADSLAPAEGRTTSAVSTGSLGVSERNGALSMLTKASLTESENDQQLTLKRASFPWLL